MDTLFAIAILVMSVVFHEVSHGYVALLLGDPTAKLSGRLTLNPLKHLDPVGSVLIPLLMAFSGGPIFGWARPVPYNPYNLQAGKWGPGLVGAAGPLSNLLLASIFSVFFRMFPQPPLDEAFAAVVYINIGLAIFNLIPVPPLDGSKLLFALLPYRLKRVQYFLESNEWILLILIVLFVSRLIHPFVLVLYALFTGDVHFDAIS